MANTRKIEWATLIAMVDEYYEEESKDEHPAYEFNKKTFKEDDNSGVYNDNPN